MCKDAVLQSNKNDVQKFNFSQEVQSSEFEFEANKIMIHPVFNYDSKENAKGNVRQGKTKRNENKKTSERTKIITTALLSTPKRSFTTL